MAEASRPKGPESPDQGFTQQPHPNSKGVMKGKDGSSDRSVAHEHSDETPGYHELAGAFMKSANKLQGGASAKPESMQEKKSTVLKTRLKKLESAKKSMMAYLEVHLSDNGSKEGIGISYSLIGALPDYDP